jgi:hypothetical protein
VVSLMSRARCGRAALISSLVLTALLVPMGRATSALAFNCGYSPCVGSPGFGAGFTQVVTAKTLPRSGGVLTGHAYGATVRLGVRPGSLPRPAEVVVGAGPPKSIHAGRRWRVVAGFSLSIINPATGAKLSGRLKPPITVTITARSIRRGDTIVSISRSGHAGKLAGGHVRAGRAVAVFTHAANFAIVRSALLARTDS